MGETIKTNEPIESSITNRDYIYSQHPDWFEIGIGLVERENGEMSFMSCHNCNCSCIFYGTSDGCMEIKKDYFNGKHIKPRTISSRAKSILLTLKDSGWEYIKKVDGNYYCYILSRTYSGCIITNIFPGITFDFRDEDMDEFKVSKFSIDEMLTWRVVD